MSPSAPHRSSAPREGQRYAVYDEIAAGGMATVHIGRLQGPVGFARTVAIKKLHPQLAKDPEFVTMFVDEARLAARIAHPNVVPTLDVVADEDNLLLVMEYVPGESLTRLLRLQKRRGQLIPPPIVASILTGVLDGLHAAHETKDEKGNLLGVVHRDVSPQNVIVGVDGVARVLDFGVAKALGRLQTTRDGQLKGKMAYMAPEQLNGHDVDRRVDVYAAAVVLWEAITCQRLFSGDNDVVIFGKILKGALRPPSAHVPNLPAGYDEVTMRGLRANADERFTTAREMARALERKVDCARASEVAEWLEEVAHTELAARAARVAEMLANPVVRASVTGIAAAKAVTDTIYDEPGGSDPRAHGAASDASSSRALPPVSAAPATRREGSGARSEVASSSVAAVTQAPVAPRPRRNALMVLGVVIAGVGLTFAVLRMTKAPASIDASATPTVVASSPSLVPSTEPAPSVPSSALAVASTHAPAPPPSAAHESEPDTLASAAPRPQATPHAGTSAPTNTKADCNPPYTTDADGVRHYKRHCG